MNNSNRESLIRVAVGLSILLVIALAAVGYTLLQGDNDEVAEAAPFGTPVAESTPEPTSSPIPTARPTRTPTVVPTPSAVPDLKFGVFPLRHSCDIYTKILVDIIETELRLNVEIVNYQGPAPLFADLSEAKLDYTLCYAGLEDREYLTDYSGYIILYDNRFVEENDIWMQPVVAARRLVDMRSNQPCFHRLMEEFKFSVADRYGTVNGWLEENEATIAEWVDCQ